LVPCSSESFFFPSVIRKHNTITLPAVLYGCETWSVTLREEHGLWVSRQIFLQKEDEVTGDWIRVHIEELHNLYSLPHITRMIKSRRK
jgi:hypothetical protein